VIGPEDKPAVPALIQLLNDPNEYRKVRRNAAEAIQKINFKIEAETTDETDFDF